MGGNGGGVEGMEFLHCSGLMCGRRFCVWWWKRWVVVFGGSGIYGVKIGPNGFKIAMLWAAFRPPFRPPSPA